MEKLRYNPHRHHLNKKSPISRYNHHHYSAAKYSNHQRYDIFDDDGDDGEYDSTMKI